MPAEGRHTRAAVAVGLIGVLLPLAGCGPSLPERSPVTGRVTVDGQPVTTGSVQFWPESGRPARGSIGEDGRYTLSTFGEGDGAVLGKHAVTIEATRVHAAGPQPKSIEDEIEMFSNPDTPAPGEPVIERLVPQRYSQRASSDLTAEVTSDGNQIDFNLSTQP